jgi:hypothetical protein
MDGAFRFPPNNTCCRPLEDAWAKGDAIVRAGGRYNAAVAPLVPLLAEEHLHTWEASLPFWYSHTPRDCTHWCHPSVYQLWHLLLNDVVRDSR